MDKEKLRLTASEIGLLWGQYVNGKMTDVVNQYMLSIIEDEVIKTIFKDAIQTFSVQKKKASAFLHLIEQKLLKKNKSFQKAKM